MERRSRCRRTRIFTCHGFWFLREFRPVRGTRGDVNNPVGACSTKYICMTSCIRGRTGNWLFIIQCAKTHSLNDPEIIECTFPTFIPLCSKLGRGNERAHVSSMKNTPGRTHCARRLRHLFSGQRPEFPHYFTPGREASASQVWPPTHRPTTSLTNLISTGAARDQRPR
jgi:hypothetical protein